MNTKVPYSKLIAQIEEDADNAIYWLEQMRNARTIEDKYDFLNKAMICAEGWSHEKLSKIEDKLYKEMRSREQTL